MIQHLNVYRCLQSAWRVATSQLDINLTAAAIDDAQQHRFARKQLHACVAACSCLKQKPPSVPVQAC